MGASKRKDYVKQTAVAKITLATAIAGDTVTVNGLVYTAVAGIKADNSEFSIDTSNAAAATDLADSINNDVRSGTLPVTLVATASTIYVVVVATSTTGLAQETTLESSGSTILLSTSKFILDGLTSNVSDNNETLKNVNMLNTPYSLQGTGADKIEGRVLLIDTETKFNALTTRQRVLFGNKEGHIKTVTASTSIVITTFSPTKTAIDTTYTMAQIIASGSLFILDEKA